MSVCGGVDRVRARSGVSLWIHIGETDRSELTSLLPSLYALLPLPAASSAVSEALTESIFKYGKGTKVLTEPLIAWTLSPSGQGLIGGAEGGELIHPGVT